VSPSLPDSNSKFLEHLKEIIVRFPIKLLLPLVGLVLTASIAAAHPSSPRIDRREAHQRARIVHGVRNGELTRFETRGLRAGQRRIHFMVRRAQADGVITRRERMMIHRAQLQQSRSIWRLKHNERDRWY
jgi:hypothetical protein